MFTTETLSTLSSEKFLLKNSYLRALCASVVSPLFDRYMGINHRQNLREPRKLLSIVVQSSHGSLRLCYWAGQLTMSGEKPFTLSVSKGSAPSAPPRLATRKPKDP